MRRLILQVANALYADLCAAATPAMVRWAQLNQWEHELVLIPDHLNFGQERYRAAVERLRQFDLVLYLDVDIVPQKTADLVFEGHKDVYISVDYNGWCCGAFALRATDWARWFAETMADRIPFTQTHRTQDQDILKAFIRQPEVGPQVGRIEESQIGNPKTMVDGSTLFHIWANKNLDDTVRRARELLAANFAVDAQGVAQR
jgi:hypothetical protein